MKNMFLTGVVCALLWAASTLPARADDMGGGLQLQLQDVPQEAVGGQIATDMDVALAYYLLIRQMPDYASWAKLSPDYQAANDFEKPNVLSGKIATYKSQVEMFTFSQALGLKLKVKLSNYSNKNKGYILLDLDDQNFLKSSFAGENFAVVPMNLADHQFVAVAEPDAIKKIEAAAGPNREFTLVAFTKVDFADPLDKMTTLDDGQAYHLISGKVAYIALYDADAKTKFYDDENKSPDQSQQDLLNLKQ